MSYQQRSPLEGILRGLQIRQMVESIKAQREARAQQAQLHQLEIEQYQQRHAADQFNMSMFLQNLGALPVAPGVTGKFEAGMGGRGTISAPSGEQYSLPTEEQRYQRAQVQARQAGTLKGIEKSAEEDLTNPMTTMEVRNPEIESGAFSRGTMQVRQKAKESIWEARQKRIVPNANITNSYDDAGNLTQTATDPRTNRLINTLTIPRVGRTTRPVGAAGGKKTLSQINLEADQDVIDKVFGGRTEIPNPAYEKAIKEAAVQRVAAGDSRNEQEADWYFRTQPEGQRELFSHGFFEAPKKRESPTIDVRKTPQYQDAFRRAKLEKLKGASGSDPGAALQLKVGDVRVVRGKQMTITKVYPDGSFDAEEQKIVSAAALPELLRHPDVQARGIRDINALRKDLVARGYTIDETGTASTSAKAVLPAANVREAARRKGMTEAQFRAWFTSPQIGGVIQ